MTFLKILGMETLRSCILVSYLLLLTVALLRTLLAIHQKSQESCFWEVMDSLVLVAYANLATSIILLQQLLACLKFTLDSEDLFCWYKQTNKQTNKQKISINYDSSTSC